MILYGTDYPILHLNTIKQTQDTQSGDGTTTTFSFDINDEEIQKNSVEVTVQYTSGGTSYTEYGSDDGNENITGDFTGRILYTGTCTLSITLSRTPDSGTDVIITVDYDHIDYSYTIDSPALQQIQTKFVPDTRYSLKMQDGTLREKKGWRLYSTMTIKEFNAYTYSDYIRMATGWHSDGVRRVILYPHGSESKGFEVVPDGEFYPERPEAWRAVKITVNFLGVKRWDYIPAHGEGEYNL